MSEVVRLYCNALFIASITVSLGLIIGTVVAFIRVTNQYSGKLKWLSKLITTYVYTSANDFNAATRI
jgi:ABC-type amino acid transport system permease subunit